MTDKLKNMIRHDGYSPRAGTVVTEGYKPKSSLPTTNLPKGGTSAKPPRPKSKKSQ